jgi:hypothetical protein
MSLLGRAKGWLGKKRPERSDRVTRAAASPSTARVSYNEDHVPLELLEDTNSARAMTFPCNEFLEAAGIKEEFYNLCANAGLTRLATCRVTQYQKLTSCFINSFRYNLDAGSVEFKIYNDLLTMPLEKFCEIIGVPNVGLTAKMSSQPSELRTFFNSLCSMDTRDIHRSKISSILFPHLRYFAYYIARGVLARDNTSNISAPDIAILATALSGRFDYNVGALIARRLAMNGNKGDLFGGVYATLILESLNGTPHPDDRPFTYLSFDLAAMKRHKFVTMTSEFGNLDYILRFGATTERKIRLPAPLLFDFSRRNGWSFDVIQFDEFVVQRQFHNPMEGVVPDEEEHGEFPPFQGETVTQFGEGSSSAWSADPSSWEDPRTSVYAPEASYDPWTHQYHPGAGGSWGH